MKIPLLLGSGTTCANSLKFPFIELPVLADLVALLVAGFGAGEGDLVVLPFEILFVEAPIIPCKMSERIEAP